MYYEENNYIVTHEKVGANKEICEICEKYNDSRYVFAISELNPKNNVYVTSIICEKCAKTPKEALVKHKNIFFTYIH